MSRSIAVACALIVALAFAVGETGCSGPYDGSPAKIKRPRRKKRPDPPPEASKPTTVAKLDDKCQVNFFSKPVEKRREREARDMSLQAEGMLREAEDADEKQRVNIILDAMNRLKNALEKDPYGPEPTYKLAVAYALVGRKGCALALLERLKLLRSYAPVEKEAARNIQRALRDYAFEAYRKEANTALGE